MKQLTGICSETELIPSEGHGYAVAVEITCTGDEDVPVSGLFLCRKGINAFPEFAEGFGFDTSKIIDGLPPERYQLKVQMLVAHQGKLLYGDGKSEFRLTPGKKVKVVMPLPFQGVQYFLTAPADDLFVAASNLSDDDLVVEVSGLHDVITKSIEDHGNLGMPYNVHLTIVVPQSAPVSDEMMAKVGTTNAKEIRSMPNT